MQVNKTLKIQDSVAIGHAPTTSHQIETVVKLRENDLCSTLLHFSEDAYWKMKVSLKVQMVCCYYCESCFDSWNRTDVYLFCKAFRSHPRLHSNSFSMHTGISFARLARAWSCPLTPIYWRVSEYVELYLCCPFFACTGIASLLRCHLNQYFYHIASSHYL